MSNNNPRSGSDRWIQTIESLLATQADARDEEGSPEDKEMQEMLTGVLPCILDQGACSGAFLLGSFTPGSSYYAQVADHIIRHDPYTQDIMKEVVQRIRSKYKAWDEYQGEMSQVPLERESHMHVTARTDDVCCICHDSLDSWRRVWRLKADSEDPSECGHLVHYRCVLRLTPSEDGTYTCPLCRADLGKRVRTWTDMTTDQPKF
jgi:hypothetical protein